MMPDSSSTELIEFSKASGTLSSGSRRCVGRGLARTARFTIVASRLYRVSDRSGRPFAASAQASWLVSKLVIPNRTELRFAAPPRSTIRRPLGGEGGGWLVETSGKDHGVPRTAWQ